VIRWLGVTRVQRALSAWRLGRGRAADPGQHSHGCICDRAPRSYSM